MSIVTRNTASILLLSALCSACIPPYRLEELPLWTNAFEAQLPVAAAASNFEHGMRYCAAHSTGEWPDFFRYAVPDCAPPQLDGATMCYLFSSSRGGVRTAFVMGQAHFRPLQEGTTAVELRIRDTLPLRHEILESWRQFVHGREREVCLPPPGK